jgi:hypothetical protein
VTRSAGGRRPFYARLLRLHYLHPGGLACFLLFEGTIGLGLLLALAELVDWPVVVLLPAGVAVMVKFNDVLAGGFRQGRTAQVARGTAVVVDVPVKKRAVGTAPAPAVRSDPDGHAKTPPEVTSDGGRG